MHIWSDNEIASLMHAGMMGGQYLDKLGKTDLASMDECEWMGTIEAIVLGYAAKMAALHAPYAVLLSADDPMAKKPTDKHNKTNPLTSDEVPY